MRAHELYENQQLFYHGSIRKLPVGTVLVPSKDYHTYWGDMSFYIYLEMYRPKNMLAHRESVFMVDNKDDIDVAGGGTDWIFTVKPLGKVERHDINWGSEVSMLADDYEGPDKEEKIEQAALNYWNGVPHPNESIWEYLAPKAKIVDVEEF